jgi:glutathione synthase/RimK-type ligase-like ATP-grasp enzyme
VGAPVRVAFATWRDAPGIDQDDRTVLDPLRRVGVEVAAAVWDDPGVDWAAFDRIVIRSTWDYHRRASEFLRWIDRPEVGRALWNRPATVRWNSNKTYLRNLEARGVAIVPTVWGSTVGSIVEVVADHGWERVVLKPSVSASGENTHLMDASDRIGLERRWEELKLRGEVLIQPFLPQVADAGERSLVFLGGEYSHAALRASRLAPAPDLKVGTAVVPSPGELAAAGRAIATLSEPTLYARVDLVTDGAGTPRVMELELIEPTLFLRTSPAGVERFAAAIGRLETRAQEDRRITPDRSNA